MTHKLEKCNVLVVDDEVGMTKGVEKTLKNFVVSIDENKNRVSFNVKSVLTEDDFYQIIEKEDFDLVLLDYKLPNVTGLELLEFIKKKKQNTLVIMITAYATFETAVQSTKLGAYDFLAKPFSPEELRNSIKKATIHLILARQARNFEEERRRIRFQFISVLSHELKAPLNAIEGYIDILSKRFDKLTDEEKQKMLERSKIRIDGMRKLIFDLLDLTRIESGEKQRNFEKFDLIQCAKSSIDLFNCDALNKNVKIHLLMKEPVEFNGDKSEMDIVFNNLISNAIKYNKDNGVVKIKIKKLSDQIKIIVADSGIGISNNDKERLFYEFVRIKNSKTMNIQGSGLGLSTLKKIVNLYGGDVKVRSTFENGSTFIVTLKTN
ncbi:MAG: ATP-binding protein [Cyanobacteriota bacterium]